MCNIHPLTVTGTTGGGTVSLWCVGHTDRFRAAAAIKPLVDWTSWVLTCSPLSLAGQIHTPVLLMSEMKTCGLRPVRRTRCFQRFDSLACLRY